MKTEFYNKGGKKFAVATVAEDELAALAVGKVLGSEDFHREAADKIGADFAADQYVVTDVVLQDDGRTVVKVTIYEEDPHD